MVTDEVGIFICNAHIILIRTWRYKESMNILYQKCWLRNNAKTVRISGELIHVADNNPDFLKRIVTGDEAWCFLYNPQSKW